MIRHASTSPHPAWESLSTMRDTIVAVSSPAGAACRAIVRLSGPDSLDAVASVFKPEASKAVTGCETYVLTRGHLLLEGFPTGIPALLYVMRSPRSFTRQDVVELHVPGSQPLTGALMEVLITSGGVRSARPGEFTERAYLSGRIDLAQAEAVMKVVNAASQGEMRLALTELEGAFSRDVEKLRQRLFDLLVQLEAALDFAEQDIELISPALAGTTLAELEVELRDLRGMAGDRYVFGDAPRVLLTGRTNVGKSSLYNRLSGSPEAIISETPQTTRDVLEVTVTICGARLTLVDAAGTIEPDGELSAAAQARARRELDKADLIVLVMDAGRPIDEEEEEILALPTSRPSLVVLNKIDLRREDGSCKPIGEALAERTVLEVSALTGDGCDDLVRAISKVVRSGRLERSGKGYLLNLRQQQGLRDATEAVARAGQTLTDDIGYEFTALEVRQAIEALSALTRPLDPEDVLERIFAEFCVGK